MAASYELITRLVPSWVIDRIEDGWAVLDNTSTHESINVPIANIPSKAKPGDTLMKYKSKWYINHVDSADRISRINERYSGIRSR